MTLRNTINGLEDHVTILEAQNAVVVGQNSAFRELTNNQNKAIDAMFLASKEREQRLADALSMPPKVIYRDKIVEVPSIESGTCEQVMMDIAKYVAGVME